MEKLMKMELNLTWVLTDLMQEKKLLMNLRF